MIFGVIGLPGSGKGYYNVCRTVVDELRSTERHIVTNHALKLLPWVRALGRRRSRPERGLLSYLRDTFGETFAAEKRIHVLPDEDFREFYLWRVDQSGQLFKLDCTRDNQGRVIEFNKSQAATSLPVVYAMDEAWKFLWSRAWQSTSTGCLYYLAQHRHMGDDLWLFGQNESQLEKAVRDLVQEWHTLVNHRYRKLGMFKQPNIITVCVSNLPPKQREKTVPKVIRFDPDGVGGCFDTAAGVGVSGASGDIERKTRGLPWWGVFAGIVLLAGGLILLARGSGWFTGKLLTGTVGEKSTPKRGTNASGLTIKAPSFMPAVSSSTASPPVRVQSVSTSAPAPVVCMSGLFSTGRGFVVFLSSGDYVTTQDRRLSFLCERFAVVDGVTNFRCPVVVGEPDSSSPSRVSPAGGQKSDLWEDLPARWSSHADVVTHWR